MAEADDPTDEDREIVELVQAVRHSGSLRPLAAALDRADGAPEHVRDALRVLAELDPELLVHVTLRTAIDAYGGRPAAERPPTARPVME